MAKLKVSELFSSVQGEGRFTGVPSVFLRTFGCNFRCPSFGRDHSSGDSNTEVEAIIKLLPTMSATTFEELPLVNTGCDTYAAVYPEFKQFSPMLTTEEIAEKITGLLPGKGLHKNQHLVITGGEPLLPGWQKAYPSLIDDLVKIGTTDKPNLFITFETNGTQSLDQSTMKYVSSHSNLHFSVSPKLMASGESRSESIQPEIVLDYMRLGLVDFKFVVDSQESIDEVVDVLNNEFKHVYNSPQFGSVYLMPAGGVESVYHANTKKVADFAMKYGFRYSPRLQVDIYGNGWGT